MWHLFGEEEGPIVNLSDDEDGVKCTIEDLILDQKRIERLSIFSRQFALKHHSDIKVGQQYVDFWETVILR